MCSGDVGIVMGSGQKLAAVVAVVAVAEWSVVGLGVGKGWTCGRDACGTPQEALSRDLPA